MSSAILVGGVQEFLAAVVVALLIVFYIPPEVGNGWTRWRVAGFFMLWQALTPIRSMILDLALLTAAAGAMEAAYRFINLKTRRTPQ